MMGKIRIGTRGSKLALWQAHYVADLLKAKGMETELVIIETRGDQMLEVPIAKIGSKGVFTQELEEQLAAGNIHLAVHSAKDMQSKLPEGFEILAFTQREKVNDVLVSSKGTVNLADRSRSWVIGTSSTRRIATLKRYFPHVKTVEIRGNLQTRFRKMEEGQCDALLLAYAGVHRMALQGTVTSVLDIDLFTPAVGQGSIAVESSTSLDQSLRSAIKVAVNDDDSEVRLIAERAFLEKLDGGCSIPIFALATLQKDRLKIRGGIISLDGKKMIQVLMTGTRSNPGDLGQKLAARVLGEGGREILKEIKAQLKK